MRGHTIHPSPPSPTPISTPTLSPRRALLTCPSTRIDEELGMMIQCETCRVWQHGICVGFQNEADCPDTYYCEQCRPDLHVDLQSRYVRFISLSSMHPHASLDPTPSQPSSKGDWLPTMSTNTDYSFRYRLFPCIGHLVRRNRWVTNGTFPQT